MIAAAAAYVALIANGWTPLPWPIQIGDVVFLGLLACLSRVAGWRWRRFDLFLLMFLAGTALSIPGSIDIRRSSVTLLKEVYLFAAYLTLSHVMVRTGALRIVRWLAVAVAATSALSLIAALVFALTGSVWQLFGQSMPLPYVGDVFRSVGTLETPEFFGNLLTVAIPLAIVCRQQAADRRWWTSAVAVMAIAELLTFSKSLAGCVAATTVLLWPQWRGQRGAVPLKVASVAAAVLLAIAFNVAAVVTVREVDVAFGKDSTVPPPSYIYARQDAAGADTIQVRIAYNPMSYFLVKRAEWHAWRRHPILGIGAGTFYLEAERAYQEGRLTQAYRRVAAHSTIFGRLAETGLVGLVTLVAALYGAWQSGLAASRSTGRDRQVAWACLAGFVGLLINGINVDIMHFRFLWLGFAASRAVEQRAGEPAIT